MNKTQTIKKIIGEKAGEICPYEWIFPEGFKIPEIVSNGSCPSLFPLDAMVRIWKHKCDECLWYL